jgi:hypothetical protein
MGKKMEQGEPKKECPSCGLGVALEATICEFCGWDFEEEDEWILQIEKLERELLLEKRKFEPGTVNHMIESTLRNPVLERIEMAQAEAASAKEEEPMTEKQRVPSPPTRELKKPEPVAPAPRRAEPKPPPVERMEPTPVFEPEPSAQKVRRVRTVKTAPAPPVHHKPEPPPTRTVRHAPPAEMEPEEPKRTRVVRKVKN